MSQNYLIEIGSIKCRISPLLDTELIVSLDNELSYVQQDSYFIDVPYQTDNRIHLFQKKRQTFYTGLLSRVKRLFDSLSVPYTIKDTRTPLTFNPENFPQDNDIEFRDYQLRAIQVALQAMGGVVELPTGAGKTLTMAGLISQIGCTPTIFYVPKTELLYQTVKAFKSFFGIDIGIIGDSILDLQPITVATVQTVHSRISRQDNEELLEWLRMVQMFVMDECHHVAATTIQEICFFHRDAYFKYGTSATPFRDDGEDLKIEAALGEKIVQVSVKELISLGYLVPPKIYFYDILPSVKTSALKSKTYPAIYKANIVEHPERNLKIVQCIKKLEQWNKTTLVLVNQIQHANELLELLQNENLHVHFIKGEVSSKIRRELLDLLHKREIMTLMATSQIGGEGLDIDSLDALINAGGGKSAVQALQRIGRTLRPCENKTESIVIEFFDNVKFLKSHSNKRKRLYQEVYGQESVTFLKSK